MAYAAVEPSIAFFNGGDPDRAALSASESSILRFNPDRLEETGDSDFLTRGGERVSGVIERPLSSRFASEFADVMVSA